jgi:hypothetical protein
MDRDHRSVWFTPVLTAREEPRLSVRCSARMSPGEVRMVQAWEGHHNTCHNRVGLPINASWSGRFELSCLSIR